MKLYCTEGFRAALTKLLRNPLYCLLEQLLEEHYCETTFEIASEGTTLLAVPTANPDIRLVKKRLAGRGGFRVYAMAKASKSVVCLTFVHPKTGPLGSANITPDTKKSMIQEVFLAFKGQAQMYKIARGEPGQAILVFRPLAVGTKI